MRSVTIALSTAWLLALAGAAQAQTAARPGAQPAPARPVPVAAQPAPQPSGQMLQPGMLQPGTRTKPPFNPSFEFCRRQPFFCGGIIWVYPTTPYVDTTPTYYAYPTPVFTPYPVYVQPQPQYWSYCPDTQAYYPYVTQCPSGWLTVVPAPPAKSPPSAAREPKQATETPMSLDELRDRIARSRALPDPAPESATR